MNSAITDDEARTKKVVIYVVALTLVSVCVMGVLIFIRSSPTGGGRKSPRNSSNLIETARAQTIYHELCISTLVTYPGVDQLVELKDVVPLTVKNIFSHNETNVVEQYI